MRFWIKCTTSALAAVALFCTLAHAQLSGQPLSLDAFAAELAQLHRLAAGCAASASACTPEAAPERQQVDGSPSGSFQISWGWLRETLRGAQSAPAADRLRAMQAVETRLDDLARTSGAETRVAKSELQRAQAAATAALAREEFRATEGPGWLDRQAARLQDWFLRLFSGVDRLGRKAPWLAPLLEWGCFGLAAAGLLFLLRRNLRRQAVRLSLGVGLTPYAGTGGRTVDWARQAELQAADGSWREAIHSLFWAAVMLLEGKKMWRANLARTPREYARLLRPGTEGRLAFERLTRAFELAWYADGRATEAQFREALGLLERLRVVTRETAERTQPAAGFLAGAGSR